MAIAGSQYIIDFVTEATAAPWSNGDWTNVQSTFQNTNGTGLRASTAGVTSSAKYNTIASADVVKAKCTFSSGASAGGGDAGGVCIFDNSSGAGYIFRCDGTSGRLFKRTIGTGIGNGIAAAFTIGLSNNTSEIEIWYDTTNGTVSAVINGSVASSATDTQYQASDLVAALWLDPQNSNLRYIGKFAADVGASAVTIDDTDADTRVTEPRTVRITVDSTAPTTANTNIYIDADTNDAIVPDSCTLVSGTTYDIVFTVPDQYAGLPYDDTGYPIVVSTADGDATSANVPYLPVTGNDFVVLTAAPGDFGTSLGTLAIGDIIEWETNGGDITVNSDGTITSTNPNTTFEARAWDATDSTYGAWALQTLGSGGGGETEGLTSAGLTTVGLTITGLTS